MHNDFVDNLNCAADILADIFAYILAFANCFLIYQPPLPQRCDLVVDLDEVDHVNNQFVDNLNCADNLILTIT